VATPDGQLVRAFNIIRDYGAGLPAAEGDSLQMYAQHVRASTALCANVCTGTTIT